MQVTPEMCRLNGGSCVRHGSNPEITYDRGCWILIEQWNLIAAISGISSTKMQLEWSIYRQKDDKCLFLRADQARDVYA